MAKEKSEKKEKKEKKDKKEKKHSDKNGVSKKDKKEKKLALTPDAADAILQDISAKEDNVDIKPEYPDSSAEGKVKIDVEMGGAGSDEEEEKKKLVLDVKPQGALVPFANPLADEKASKKVFKSVKKGASPSLPCYCSSLYPHPELKTDSRPSVL